MHPFGTDSDAALAAYSAAERANGWRGKLDIVLLGSDSLATIEATHSSYLAAIRGSKNPSPSSRLGEVLLQPGDEDGVDLVRLLLLDPVAGVGDLVLLDLGQVALEAVGRAAKKNQSSAEEMISAGLSIT